MSIETLAAEISAKTGWTGAELEAATHFTAMLFADAVGAKDAGNHFEKRMQQAWNKHTAAA